MWLSRFLPLSLSGLLLAACASVVPGTAARLSALDPLAADPGQIEVALILPPGMQVAPDGAVLTLEARRGDQRLGGSFVLEERAAPGVVAPDGASVTGFGLAAGDLARMRDLQAGIAAWKAEGEATGSLSVGVGGCRLGAGPATDAKGAVMIRLAEDEPFRPLIRPTRLADVVGTGPLAAMEPCNGAH